MGEAMSLNIEQDHLNYSDTINYGSFYTPPGIVDLVYDLLKKNIPDFNQYTIVDTSCGYGSFLRLPRTLGADLDPAALKEAAFKTPSARLFQHNSLAEVHRAQYGLDNDAKLIIVGNPPYNDRTSLVRHELKKSVCDVDNDLKHRDLGISFLLSYNKLKAGYICVLHPLSYLIKKANFESLGPFRYNYQLKDGIVISSGEFAATSKTMRFPILIGFYQRTPEGMSHNFIRGYPFKIKEGPELRLDCFDEFGWFTTKYPNQKSLGLDKTAAFFWTMRDINALKRSRTFVEKEVPNSSIRVPAERLPYYCYADVFKDYLRHIPYYFGNCDILLDHGEFEKIKDAFVAASLEKYQFLQHILTARNNRAQNYAPVITSYFKNLFGKHYADC
jgi:hypothetical protein